MIHSLKEAKEQKIAPWDNLAWENQDVAVYHDKYPVTKGHLLFVPKHNGTIPIETAFGQALKQGNMMVEQGECDAFNVGINCGAEAGQTVMYPHVHLIPRRVGDCADPVGGVRGVVAGQANYHTDKYTIPNQA